MDILSVKSCVNIFGETILYLVMYFDVYIYDKSPRLVILKLSLRAYLRCTFFSFFKNVFQFFDKNYSIHFRTLSGKKTCVLHFDVFPLQA